MIFIISIFFQNNHINVTEELEKKSVSTDKKCPVEDCGKPTSDTSGNRLCEYVIFYLFFFAFDYF
jgi:hypothetical protein